MKKTKKNKKANKKIKDRKSLFIAHYGDYVVIKNRPNFAATFSGLIMLSLCVACGIMLREAFKMPMFAVAFSLIALSIVYSFVSIAFSKILLDSPNMQMTVYNPFKKQYKFDDISYIDVESSKPKDGYVTHTVTVYIGSGKKQVEIRTTSKKQADQLLSLLRGMLDNAAMIYPEGDEEPFVFDDDKKKQQGVMPFGIKRNKKNDSKEENTPITKENDLNNKDNSKVNDKEPLAKKAEDAPDKISDEKNEDAPEKISDEKNEDVTNNKASYEKDEEITDKKTSDEKAVNEKFELLTEEKHKEEDSAPKDHNEDN